VVLVCRFRRDEGGWVLGVGTGSGDYCDHSWIGNAGKLWRLDGVSGSCRFEGLGVAGRCIYLAEASRL
jgi:hypothetical protein